MTTESQQNIGQATNEISLKEFIVKLQEWYRYILSKWLIIGMVSALGAILGFTYAYLYKPIYKATTTFVLEESNSGSGGLGGLGGLASMVGIDIGGGGGLFTGDNILELYKSRTMIQKTLLSSVDIAGKQQLLIDRYIEFNKFRKNWRSDALKNIEFNTYNANQNHYLQDSLIGEFGKTINLENLVVSKLDKKLSIFKVEMSSKDEIFAKLFTEKIVSNVNEFYILTRTKRSTQNVSILQEKTDSVRNIMRGAINTAAAIVDATPNINPVRQAQRNAPVQRAQFSAETNKAILGELVKNLELSKIALLKETPLVQIIDHPVYPLEKQKLGKIKTFILGGFLAFFFIIFFLTFKRITKQLGIN